MPDVVDRSAERLTLGRLDDTDSIVPRVELGDGLLDHRELGRAGRLLQLAQLGDALCEKRAR